MNKTLEELLEQIGVLGPGQWDNNVGPREWFAVVDDLDGIIAYFEKEKDALYFRLAYINRILNS